MSNKLSHIYNIAGSLQRDIKAFYDSNEFYNGDEPCLPYDFCYFNNALEAMKDNCNLINNRIDDEIKAVKERLSQSKS